jgi:hypothetical protein
MIGREGEATLPHIKCLMANVAKVQSSILMGRMDFSASRAEAAKLKNVSLMRRQNAV